MTKKNNIIKFLSHMTLLFSVNSLQVLILRTTNLPVRPPARLDSYSNILASVKKLLWSYKLHIITV